MLTEQQGQGLIKLARTAIETYFSDTEPDTAEYKKDFSDKQGVFVTLYSDSSLRGCIGFPESVYRLYEAIIKAARAAAFSDPRFIPISKEELDKIRIELSVLTKPQEIKVESPEQYSKEIEIGKDGLIIRAGPYSGLLLPQVFTEHKCNAEQALSMTCEKAGLSPDAWKNLETKVYKFQAQIFKEGFK